MSAASDVYKRQGLSRPDELLLPLLFRELFPYQVLELPERRVASVRSADVVPHTSEKRNQVVPLPLEPTTFAERAHEEGICHPRSHGDVQDVQHAADAMGEDEGIFYSSSRSGLSNPAFPRAHRMHRPVGHRVRGSTRNFVHAKASVYTLLLYVQRPMLSSTALRVPRRKNSSSPLLLTISSSRFFKRWRTTHHTTNNAQQQQRSGSSSSSLFLKASTNGFVLVTWSFSPHRSLVNFLKIHFPMKHSRRTRHFLGHFLRLK